MKRTQILLVAISFFSILQARVVHKTRKKNTIPFHKIDVSFENVHSTSKISAVQPLVRVGTVSSIGQWFSIVNAPSFGGGIVSEATAFLAQNVDFSIDTPGGNCTALQYAAGAGNVALCTYLLQKGASVLVADNLGNTALHYAAQSGNLTVTNLLLKNGASQIVVNNAGQTPAQVAKGSAISAFSGGGSLSVLPNVKGWFAVVAEGKGTVAAMATFLDNNAGFNISTQDDAKKTALQYAAAAGNKDLCKFLLQQSANINDVYTIAKVTVNGDRIKIALKSMVSNLTKDAKTLNILQNTAFLLCQKFLAAALTGDIAIVLKNGGVLTATDDSGNTALHYAAAEGNAQVCQILIANGADLRAVNAAGQTPAQVVTGDAQTIIAGNFLTEPALQWFTAIAGGVGSPEAVKQVLATATSANNIDVNMQDNFNTTGLQYAAVAGNKELCSYLLSRGANIDDVYTLTTTNGVSISPSVKVFDKQTVRVLVNTLFLLYEAGVTTPSTSGNPPIMTTGEAILSLIADGAVVQATDSAGNTALHYAAQAENIDACKALLQKGASNSVKNKAGQIPYDLAVLTTNDSLMAVLKAVSAAQ